MTGVIGWKLGRGVVIDPDQVADRVAVLDPVQPPDGHAAGVGVLGIDPERSVLDPVFQETSSPLRSGAGLPAGGMMPARTFLSTRHHKSRSCNRARSAPSSSRTTPPFFQPVAVAGVTMVFEDRPDLAGRTVPRTGLPADETGSSVKTRGEGRIPTGRETRMARCGDVVCYNESASTSK